jgi:hypothetical protein
MFKTMNPSKDTPDLWTERDRAIEERRQQMPGSCRNTYLTATRGRCSPVLAIKAFCSECVCWDRQEVRNCTALACPLYKFRPFTRDSR